MTFVVPVDFQPALAAHVSQITDALTGVSAEPITLTNMLTLAVAGGTAIDLRGHILPDTTRSYDIGDVNRRLRSAFFGGAVNFEMANTSAAPEVYSVAADTQPRLRVRPLTTTSTGFDFGPGGATATDTSLYRSAAGTLTVAGSLNSEANNTRDLGTTSLRWRKLWGVDADLSGGLVTAGNVGVGVTPGAWGGGYLGLQVGQSGSVWSSSTGPYTFLSSNVLFDGTNRRSVTNMAATELRLLNGQFSLSTAPAVAAGAVLTFVDRIAIGATGSVTLTPDAGSAALLTVGDVTPTTTNARDLGATALRWRKLWATDADLSGAIAVGTSVTVAPGSPATQFIRTTSNVNNVDGTAQLYVQRTVPTTNSQRINFQGGISYDYLIGRKANADALVFQTWSGAAITDRFIFTELGNLGVGLYPTPCHSSFRTVQVGAAATLMGNPSDEAMYLIQNSYLDTSAVYRAVIGGNGASYLYASDGAMSISTAPQVGTNAAQTFTTRFVVNQNGGVGLTPAAGVAAITIGTTAQPKVTVSATAPSSPMTGDLWMW